MDTMVMAVRVALLILVTGTFTVLWSGDHPDQIAAVDRPSKVLVGRRKCSQECLPLEIVHSWTESPAMTAGALRHSEGKLTKAPLPDGIQAGTYLVADQFGRTVVRIVSELEVASLNTSLNTVVANHYSVVVGNARWHYIRIDQTAADRMAVSAETSKSF